MGLSDLAVAVPVFEAAQKRGLGSAISYPTPCVPRWVTLANGGLQGRIDSIPEESRHS